MDDPKNDWERIFGLFKLEYEQAAERYENIYKAVWQIFSYMGILAAGILTFGARNSTLPIVVTAFIALTPLVFWFLAIYIPMNHYGEDQGKHLADIENGINDISKDFLNPPWELKHYRNFDSRKEDSDSQKVKFYWRVTYAVCVFGVIIIIGWIILLGCTITHYINLTQKPSSEKLELKLEPIKVTMQEPQLQKLKSKLDSLSQKIDSLESLIREIQADTNQQ